MDTKEVKIKAGSIVLNKPNAGTRNKVVLESCDDGKLNEIKLLINLIPYCVKSHPFGTIPIRQALDNLEIEEYDKIVSALQDLMKGTGDVEKKSEKPSKTKDTPPTDG